MSFVIPPVDYSANVTTTKYAWKEYHLLQDRNPPVKDTEYTLIDETGGVEVDLFGFYETNTETDAKEVDIEIIVDGTTYTFVGGSVEAIPHADPTRIVLNTLGPNIAPFLDIDYVDKVAPIHMADTSTILQLPYKGHDISIKYTMTAVAGTAQRLYASAIYRLLEAV